MKNNGYSWGFQPLNFGTSGYLMKRKLYVYSYSLVLHLMEQALKDVAPHATKVSVETYRCAHRLWLAWLISAGALVREGTEHFKVSLGRLGHVPIAIPRVALSCNLRCTKWEWLLTLFAAMQILAQSGCLPEEMEMAIRQSLPSAFCSSIPSGSQVSVGVAD